MVWSTTCRLSFHLKSTGISSSSPLNYPVVFYVCGCVLSCIPVSCMWKSMKSMRMMCWSCTVMSHSHGSDTGPWLMSTLPHWDVNVRRVPQAESPAPIPHAVDTGGGVRTAYKARSRRWWGEGGIRTAYKARSRRWWVCIFSLWTFWKLSN